MGGSGRQVILPTWYMSIFESTLYGLSGYFSSANEFSVGEAVEVDMSSIDTEDRTTHDLAQHARDSTR